MNKLNLTQLNKQKVAEREMKAIEGGDEMGPVCYYGGNRSMNEYIDTYWCSHEPWDMYLLSGMLAV